MANIDNPTGLTAVRHLFGNDMRLETYRVASGLAENIGNGAPVKSTGTGKRVQLAAPGDAIRGVFAGVEWVDSTGQPQYAPNWTSGTVTKGSVDAVALIYDDPAILFAVQASAGFAEANVGANADLTANGVNSSGLSTAEVDSATFTTASAQVRIYDYVRDDINEVTTNAKLLVLINEHELKTTAGV